MAETVGYQDNLPHGRVVPDGERRLRFRATANCGTNVLIGEIFYSVKQAKVIFERWRCHYHTIRPHSALGYQSASP